MCNTWVGISIRAQRKTSHSIFNEICFLVHISYVSNLQGDYVIVDPIEEGEKVKAEISFILYKDHIQNLQKQQLW